jgi:hypothetical protein
MADEPFASDSATEQIVTSALVPAALGNYDEGFDPYNNAVVYFFAFLGCLFVVFGFVAIGVALYRLAKHRPHASRGLVVATVATLVGIGVTVAAFTQV